MFLTASYINALPFTSRAPLLPPFLFIYQKERKKKSGSRLTDVLVPQFNVLWLDPINPDTFPTGLLDAVNASTAAAATPPAWSGNKGEERSLEQRLREQMRTNALQPLGDDDDDDDDDEIAASLPKNTDVNSESHLPPKWIEDAAQFLRLNVSHNFYFTTEPPAAVLSLPRAPLFFILFSLALAD